MANAGSPKDISRPAVDMPASISPDPADRASPDLLLVALAWVRAREVREREFGENLFSDPAWNILLDVYINQRHGKRISISSLCMAAGAPMSTAVRWINLLVDRGLIARQPDQFDRRRFFIVLTEDGLARMERTLVRTSESDAKLGLGRLQLVD